MNDEITLIILEKLSDFLNLDCSAFLQLED